LSGKHQQAFFYSGKYLSEVVTGAGGKGSKSHNFPSIYMKESGYFTWAHFTFYWTWFTIRIRTPPSKYIYGCKVVCCFCLRSGFSASCCCCSKHCLHGAPLMISFDDLCAFFDELCRQ